MTLRNRIEDDIKTSFKAGEKERVAVLRMLKSKLQERQLALRADKGTDYELTDDESEKVIAAYAKQRRDSIDSYTKAGRAELADKERGELAIVETYLPEQLDDDALKAVVAEVVRETGASSPKEMGAVMKGVMGRVAGGADGKRVQKFVREALG